MYTLIYQKWPPIRAVIGVDYWYNGNVSQLIRPTTATCMTALQLRCMCLHSASLKDAIPFCSVSATPYRVCCCAPDVGQRCMLLWQCKVMVRSQYPAEQFRQQSTVCL